MGLFDYVKKNWKDYPDTSTPVNAANLNHMDNQIAKLSEGANSHEESIGTIEDRLDGIDSSLSIVKTYVNEEDGKLHFVDATGADSVLNFNRAVFGTYTFSSDEVLEIDTGLPEIKRFVLYNDPSVRKENNVIYDSRYPSTYRGAYDMGASSNAYVSDIGSRYTVNGYAVMAINGGKITLKAPESSPSGCNWFDTTWIAQ